MKVYSIEQFKDEYDVAKIIVIKTPNGHFFTDQHSSHMGPVSKKWTADLSSDDVCVMAKEDENGEEVLILSLKPKGEEVASY